MVDLYVVSVEEAAGKTTVCAGLARNLVNDGKKVAYKGKDASFMKAALGLAENEQGVDVVLTEGVISPETGHAAGGAGVIAVAAYPVDAAGNADAYKAFGGNLLGVVLNKVPQSMVNQVRAEAAAGLENAGIRLLGVLPEERVLFAITVGELADVVKGRILNNAEKAGELVENYMLGAMVVDSGLGYFSRKGNKAAILRHDRPDMQLAALETSTRCLVLSNGAANPLYNVMEKAESRGIPVISTESTTGDIISGIEDALAANRLGQDKKLGKLAEIVKQNLGMPVAL